MDPGPGRLILFAPSVHTGGGMVLLADLLKAPVLPPALAFVDARASQRLAELAGGRVELAPVQPSVRSRLAAQLSLRRVATAGDTVLCLQGLAPLLPSRARVVVFQQNRLLIERADLSDYSPRTRLQIALSRIAGRLTRGRVAAWFVQTDSMRRALLAWHGGTPDVRVMPFSGTNEAAVPAAVPGAEGRTTGDSRRWDFVYVSDGVPHKNHRRLIEAWALLAGQGLRPSLALTLGERDSTLARWIAEQAASRNLRVENLGHLGHDAVLALYRSAGALVFPSLLESFGLPLVEASRLGVPIVASERDYVRDVCVPAQTFDPTSAVSIARAVTRYLGNPEPPAPVRSAAEFIEAVLR